MPTRDLFGLFRETRGHTQRATLLDNMRKGFLLILLVSLTGCVPTERVYVRESGHEVEEKNDGSLPLTSEVGDMKSCTLDSDCVAVGDICCGCGSGGANVAINAKYNAVWEKYRADRCKGIACAAVISSHPTCRARPVCDQGQCTLK